MVVSTAPLRSSARSPSVEAAQVRADPVGAGDEPGDRLVDEVAGSGIAPPVDRQLDGLVGHRALGGGGGPRELLGLLGQVTGPRSRARSPSRRLPSHRSSLVGQVARPAGPGGPRARPAAPPAAGGRTRAARGAGRRGPASTSCWAGLSSDAAPPTVTHAVGIDVGFERARVGLVVGFEVGVGDQLHGSTVGTRVRHRRRCHTPRVDWTGGAVVLPPLRPGRPGPRQRLPGPRPHRARVPEPAAARRGAAVDQAVARRRHGGRRRAGSAVAGGAGRPGGGRRGRQRPARRRGRRRARAGCCGRR